MSCYSEGLMRCNCGRCIGDSMDRMAPRTYPVRVVEPDGCINECADLGRPGWADDSCAAGMCSACCEDAGHDDAHGLSYEEMRPDVDHKDIEGWVER